MALINVAGASQNLDASLNTIISEFRLQSEEGGTVKPLVRHFKLEPHSGASKVLLNYSTLTAYGVSDGVDIAQAQSLADAQTTITPSEVAVQVIVTDRTLSRVADPELYRRTGQMMASAYVRKEDTDICTQFASFSPNVGAAGTIVGIGHLLAAVQKLRVGNSNSTPEPAPDPIYGVFHPGQLTGIMGRLIPLGASAAGGTVTGTADAGDNSAKARTVGAGRTDWSDDILKRGKKAISTLFNVPIYDDANIAVDSSNDAKGGVFSKEGIVHVEEIAPQAKPERDESLRATELNFIGSYGVGLYRSAAYGVYVYADASIATS